MTLVMVTSTLSDSTIKWNEEMSKQEISNIYYNYIHFASFICIFMYISQNILKQEINK